MRIVFIIVVFVIATIPLLFAGVQPWVWSFYGLCMMSAFVVFLWQAKAASASRPLVSGYLIAVTLFFASGLLACLPLAPAVLARVSQVRYNILASAWALLEDSPSWQTISYMPEKSLAWLMFLLSLILFFFILKKIFAETSLLKRLVFVMICVALFEAVYGLIQALVPSMGILWVDYIQAGMGSARGTFVNRNNFAGFMEMTWPLALGFTLAQGGWRQGDRLRNMLSSDRLNRQALLALGIVVMVLALFFSGSRAGITGGSIGFLTFIFLVRFGIKRTGFFPWALLGGIAFLLLIYSTFIGVGPIFERFLLLNENMSRLDIWCDSWAIINEHPLGIGLRNYETVFPLYNQSLITDKSVTYAHNDYLQLLLEIGWLGFFALTGAFFAFLGKSVIQIKKIDPHKEPFRYFLACGAFSGIVSIAFHGFFDFNLQIPANCVYFITLLAILYSCAWGSPDSKDNTDKKYLQPMWHSLSRSG
jgi:O-antigen ligase